MNVAIGCAGLPALVDLRGSSDHLGRELATTVIALADEVAAASGLVMGKADRVPVAIARGLGVGIEPTAPDASALVRRPEDDLFREAPLWSIRSASPSTAFERGRAIPREALEEALAAAVASDGPTFVVATSDPARRRLAAAVARLDPTADAILRDAGALVVPFVDLEEVTDRDAVMLAAGATIERFALALHAQALAWAWTDASRERSGAVRWALGVEENWTALGIVAIGEPSAGAATSRPPLDLSALRFL